jgi:diguanylate cyclase (GGDEF)-like protein
VERLQEELREQVLHDPLTGLYNRRYLAEMLEHEIARTEREKESLSIIVSDIDHFKVINDTYGHQAGDRFLVEIAGLLKRFTRSSDLICRYGGEEFVLVFPGAAGDSAVQRAEEIRQKCAEVIIQHEGKDLSVTMSFGLAIYPDHGKNAEEIIIKADKALYISKQTGRNRVTVWTNGQS